MNTRIKHVLLEVFYEDGLDIEKLFREGATFDDFKEKDISFTYADYELCYAGKTGIVQTLDDFVGFGGDMDIDPSLSDYHEHNAQLKKEWEKIAKRKVQEGYEEYMLLKKKYMLEHGIKDDLE
ncbi:hypothetical protein [uncultured Enterococcus sp.]|uniref:hypothetical protein n=1 Tax=uncultured Enterococcus sp. TaxID=167972 RepID=UPI002AA63E19|nr:hypothetical protein [uncultured Enterococcus sp.]